MELFGTAGQIAPQKSSTQASFGFGREFQVCSAATCNGSRKEKQSYLPELTTFFQTNSALFNGGGRKKAVVPMSVLTFPYLLFFSSASYLRGLEEDLFASLTLSLLAMFALCGRRRRKGKKDPPSTHGQRTSKPEVHMAYNMSQKPFKSSQLTSYS